MRPLHHLNVIKLSPKSELTAFGLKNILIFKHSSGTNTIKTHKALFSLVISAPLHSVVIIT